METFNIGWFYQREYFRGVDLSQGVKTSAAQESVKKANKRLLGQHAVNSSHFISQYLKVETKSTYPGIATGIGMKHETGIEGELKLGMYFDYTSGQPCIPGASVKGALRSAFPQFKNYRRSDDNDERKIARAYLLHYILFVELGVKDFELTKSPLEKHYERKDFEKIEKLECEIFDGERSSKKVSVYERDIFHDAFITKADSKGKMIGDDAITHHPGPLVNPNPVLFLKIMSGVTLQFNFDLKDGNILSAEQKRLLFERILLRNGIGAKTNVGYGQLEPAQNY